MSEDIKTKVLSASDDDIKIAAQALIAGRLVAFPTETVYGLGGDAFNSRALAKIFSAKNRPYFDPLIVHVAALEDIEKVANLSLLTKELRDKLDKLCQNLLPGPLTLILPKKPEIPSLATSDLPTVAVRFPNHPVAQKLIKLSTGAVAAPSANPFGYLSPTRAEHVLEQLGNRVDFIIDGGQSNIGVESTVLDISANPPKILRPGGTAKEAIEAMIGHVEVRNSANSSIKTEDINSPGLLKSHYAPKTPLFLYNHEEMIALPYDKSEAYLFFSIKSRREWEQSVSVTERDNRIFTLSEIGDLTEAASNLFEQLHRLDKLAITAIRAERVPDAGLGLAINDRLTKAGA